MKLILIKSQTISTGEEMDRQTIPMLPSHFSSDETECLYKVIDTFPSVIILLDINKNICFWNRSAEKIFCCKIDDVMGKQLSFIPQYHAEEFGECIDSVSSPNYTSNIIREFVLSGCNGNIFLASVTFSQISFSVNKYYIMLLIEDVSRCGFSEDGRILKDNLAGKLIEAMLDGFSVLGTDGSHTAVNQSFCEMTGFSRKDLIGTKPPYLYWPEEEYENIQKAFDKTLESDFNDFELIFKRKNGERFPVIVTQSKIGYIYFYDEKKQEFILNTWSREVMMQCKIAESQTVYQLEKSGIWGEAVRQ